MRTSTYITWGLIAGCITAVSSYVCVASPDPYTIDFDDLPSTPVQHYVQVEKIEESFGDEATDEIPIIDLQDQAPEEETPLIEIPDDDAITEDLSEVDEEIIVEEMAEDSMVDEGEFEIIGEEPAADDVMEMEEEFVEEEMVEEEVVEQDIEDLEELEALEDIELIEIETERDLSPGIEVIGDEEAQNLISITLDEVPLQDVIRMFTRISGANIVAGTNLQGNVTVSLNDVEWEPALQVILDSVDLALVEKTPGIFSVLSQGDLAAEPVKIETIFLDFTTVSNILPIVQRMLVSTNASASGFPSANAIIIQETSSRIGQIRSTISEIDRQRYQVFIEAKFVELNDQAIKDLGIDWQVLQGYNLTLGNLSYGYSKNKSRDIATTETFSDRDTLTDLDIKSRIEQDAFAQGENSVGSSFSSFPPLTFGSDSSSAGGQASVSGSNFDSFDVTDGTISPVPVRERTKTRERQTENTVSSSKIFDTLTSEIIGATLSAQEFQLTLSALKQNDGVGIVSNPKLIVASGETASILVGRNEPNVVAVPQGDNGDRFAYQLDGANPFIEIGVKLDVTPTVNTEDNISVKIVPELSRKLGDLIVGEANTTFPITQVRRIVTEFNLQAGHTVAIGGLTETTDREQVRKVPLLGDIPLLGKYFFTHTHTEKVQDEIVIFVTVGLAAPDTLVEASGIPSDARLIHRHMAQRALQAQDE